MNKNTRYIKTEVDNTPKIVHLLSCNLCPFLIYDNGPKVSRCAKYHSISTNITDSNIYSYSSMGDCIVPIKEVSIPDWCGLPEGESLVKATGDMFVKDGHNSYKTVSNIYQNLVIMSGLYIDYDIRLMKLVSGENKKIDVRVVVSNESLNNSENTSAGSSDFSGSSNPLQAQAIKEGKEVSVKQNEINSLNLSNGTVSKLDLALPFFFKPKNTIAPIFFSLSSVRKSLAVSIQASNV